MLLKWMTAFPKGLRQSEPEGGVRARSGVSGGVFGVLQMGQGCGRGSQALAVHAPLKSRGPWLGPPALCPRQVLWRPLPALWDHEQLCGPLGLSVLMAKFRARARTPRPLRTPVPGSFFFRVLLVRWCPRLAVSGGGRWAPAGRLAACPSHRQPRRQTRPGRALVGEAVLT